jgi:integrase
VVENEPKTVASRRTLPLDEGLLAVLRRRWARYAQEKLALGAAHADSGYVAVNEAGQPYTPGALTHMWRKLAKTAGVRPIRLHDARHSCGTALHLRGVPLAVIAKWLGHANPAITARIYAHSQDEALAAAAASLGAVVTNEGVLRDLWHPRGTEAQRVQWRETALSVASGQGCFVWCAVRVSNPGPAD